MIRTVELLRAATARLAAAGIAAPAREARLLLLHALGRADGTVLDPAMPVEPSLLNPLLERRAAREPMALIRGRQGFWTLDLAVSPATLIPRADSETLIEAALAALPERSRVRRILDLGTGSGALLLAALSEFTAAFGIGIDIAPAALHLARDNAQTAQLSGRTALICGSWAASIAGHFDLVLSNPPYIPTLDILRLMPEVAAHEPRAALDGGPDGLDAYRALLVDVARLLAPSGRAVLELGVGQADDVIRLADLAGLQPAQVATDLGGIDRALVLRRGDG